ncbi:MAG: hypothetical protein WDW36_006464 [Sanguina aurantia]
MAAEDIDWDAVDEELTTVAPEFQHPRFHPLKHVVDIFSARDPQRLTAELRDTEERLSELVDVVVDGLHVGFARSIQNYSHILQLFNESKEQVDALKRSLAVSGQQLGAHSPLLCQQWQKSISLAASQHLLNEVQHVVDIPHRIDEALLRKDWPAAVNHLLDGCTRLAQDGLLQVRALRKLRSDMSSLSRWILGQMCDELESRIYDLDTPLLLGSSGGSPLLPTTSGLPPPRPARSRSASGKLAESIPTVAAGGDVTGACTVVPTQLLVSCLAQVDGVVEAKTFVHYNMRAEIRRVLVGAAEQCLLLQSRQRGSAPATQTAQAAQQLVAAVCKAAHKLLARLVAVISEVALAPASSGLSAMMKKEEGAALAAELGKAPPPWAGGYLSGGLGRKDRLRYLRYEIGHGWGLLQEEFQLLLSNLLLAPVRDPSEWQHRASNGLSSVKMEGFDKWMEGLADQAEKFLIRRTVAAGLPNLHTVAAETAPAPAQRAASRAADVPKLTFAFQAFGSLSDSEYGDVSGASKVEALTYGTTVTKILGNQPGSSYLTPAVYLPIMDFVDSAVRLLQEAEDKRGLAHPAATDSTTTTTGFSHNTWLHRFLEEFIVDGFLPQVWVDLRGRVTAALEHPAAFLPALKFGAVSAARLQERRAILPAALFIEGVLQELAEWAQSMPGFKDAFNGVADSILGRLHDAFTASMVGTVGTHSAGTLAARPDLAHCMACEPDARWLAHPIAFYVPKSSDPGDVKGFLEVLAGSDLPVLIGGSVAGGGRPGASPALQRNSGGFALGAEPAEVETALFVFRNRQAGAQHLMLEGAGGAASGLQRLSALSQSCDFVVDCVTGQQAHAARPSQAAVHLGVAPAPVVGAWAALLEGLACDPSIQLTEPALHCMHRFKAVGGACVRTLRLEMQLLVQLHLRQLSLASHLCGEGDARELHPSVGALTRAALRAVQEVSPFLSPAKLHYVFGGMANAAARSLMWILPEIGEINGLGVERMVRTLTTLQPMFLNLAPPRRTAHPSPTKNSRSRPPPAPTPPPRCWEASSPCFPRNSASPHPHPPPPHPPPPPPFDADPVSPFGEQQQQQRRRQPAPSEHAAECLRDEARTARVYNTAREYYGLLNAPPEEVLRCASESPGTYTAGEWLALLQVHVPHRMVTDVHLQQLQRILAVANGMTAGQKVADAMGNVLASIQAPAEKLTDTLVDTLNLGRETLLAGVLMGTSTIVAGVKIPAQQLQRVFRKMRVVNPFLGST